MVVISVPPPLVGGVRGGGELLRIKKGLTNILSFALYAKLFEYFK